MGKTVLINAKGMVGGLRKKENGLVYFGNKSHNENNEIINDFVIETSIQYEGDSLFLIYYRRDYEEYYLKKEVKSEKAYCFAKLDFPYVGFF